MFMRTTFTLEVEFRGDMRGQEKRDVTEALQWFAAEHGIQTFGYEDNNIGCYAFMAHPDCIDEAMDGYGVLVFRDVLEPWLSNHLDIKRHTIHALLEQSDIFPRTSSKVVEQGSMSSGSLRFGSDNSKV